MHVLCCWVSCRLNYSKSHKQISMKVRGGVGHSQDYGTKAPVTHSPSIEVTTGILLWIQLYRAIHIAIIIIIIMFV